jgi:hypothetical protein
MPTELFEVEDVQKLRNWTAEAAEWLNRSSFRIYVGGNDLARFNSSGVWQNPAILLGSVPTVALAQSSTDEIVYSAPLSDLWVTGNLYVTLYWSGVTAANTVSIDCSVQLWAVDSTVGSKTTVSLTGLADPASQLKSDRFGPFAITTADDLMTIIVERGTDSHAADIIIAGMFLDFRPSRR